ncbi:MAG: type II toxin-antitoxin system RelE/ParE family toxin [Xanthomonadaceae bacterium]|nr:type II toxin-antitoxin system RelE/ParE family toxin [Xanthomonadaceae bacterium]MDE2084076.1 type II toxin-antitoxin system RelE/ParE family toxin [Xanthomonadaceae bacterium]MDE2257184.1 type II toxin-antitoxin system RelE/ParE family toxin [Xanthomonadaceae bacterium]
MKRRPVVRRWQAQQDIAQALAWYEMEADAAVAQRFIDAVEAAIRHIAEFPASGSPRYAPIVKMDGLRVWPLKRFPHLVFYIERGKRIDVWRVLHGERDIAAWLHEGE